MCRKITAARRARRIHYHVGERQTSLGRSEVAESPDTFRSRPESKKPFQLHLRTSLVDSNWYVFRTHSPRVHTTRVRDTRRGMALYVYARRRLSHPPPLSLSLSSLSALFSSLFLSLRSSKRVREAASYMIHSLYKNNRLL